MTVGAHGHGPVLRLPCPDGGVVVQAEGQVVLQGGQGQGGGGLKGPRRLAGWQLRGAGMMRGPQWPCVSETTQTSSSVLWQGAAAVLSRPEGGGEAQGMRGGTHLDQVLARHPQVKGIPVLKLAAHLLQQSLHGGAGRQATAMVINDGLAWSAAYTTCSCGWTGRQLTACRPAARGDCLLDASGRLACRVSEGMGLPAGSSPPR